MKKFLIAAVVLALIAGGWYRLKHRGASDSEAEQQEKPTAKVETVPLKRQDMVRTLVAFGVVGAAPSGEHVISAPYDCLIRQVFVGVGTTVAAGDPLLEIEPSRDTQLALESARSTLALASKTLAATQERYELKLVTSQDLLAAQQAEQDARLKVANFEARGLGGNGKITAKTAGIVSKLELTSGALAPIGTPLVSVASDGKLEARLGIEPGDLSSVVAGQRAVLVSANRSEVNHVVSTVRSVGGGLDPTTGAVEVRVPIPPGAPLFLGEHVQATIEIERKPNVLVAPRSAVLPDDEKRVLFTVKDGKAARHEVKPGIISDDGMEVTGDNLHAGDLVVTLGNYELTDGMAVQIGEKTGPGPDAKETPATKEAKP